MRANPVNGSWARVRSFRCAFTTAVNFDMTGTPRTGLPRSTGRVIRHSKHAVANQSDEGGGGQRANNVYDTRPK